MGVRGEKVEKKDTKAKKKDGETERAVSHPL